MAELIDRADLQAHGKHKIAGELGGHSFQEWLGHYRARKMAGEPLRALLSWNEREVLIVRDTERHGPASREDATATKGPASDA